MLRTYCHFRVWYFFSESPCTISSARQLS